MSTSQPDDEVTVREAASDIDSDSQAPTVASPESIAGFVPGNTIKYFGDYEILEEIARGGMGVVYKARQVSLNRIVAVKMILSGQLAGEANIKRFRSEAEAVANLQHSNIVALHEVGEHDGKHYFSMDYVEGKNLAQCISDFGLPIFDSKKRDASSGWTKSKIKNQKSEIAMLLMKVARAVHYAHQRGILHRDLKPGNILIDANDEPHVTDFGLAKRLEGESDLTHTGAIMGTPNYMAPEQARGVKQLSTAVDVYSLGAILYQLLTGRPPFQADTPIETLRAAAEQEPTRPSAISSNVDRDLETICLKCLEKDSQRRYGSAEALAEDLECWLKHEPISARRSGGWERAVKWARRKPAVAGLIGLVGFVAVCGVTGVMSQWRRAEGSLLKSESNLYINRIARAQRELADGNIGLTEQLLDDSPPNLRHWEWHYLNRLCQADHRTIEAAGRTTDLAFSHDGKRLAATSATWKETLIGNESFEDLVLQIWDVESGKPITSISLPIGTKSIESRTASPVFLAGDRLVATRDGYRTVNVWSVETGQLLFRFNDQKLEIRSAKDSAPFDPEDILGNLTTFLAEESVAAIAFSPDGSRATYLDGTNLKVLDASNGRELLTIPGMSSSLLNMGNSLISANGQFLAGTIRDDVRLWNLVSEEPHVYMVLNHDQSVTDIAFSSNNRLIASASEDHTVKVWNVQNGDEMLVFEGHRRPVNWICFSPDNARLASVCQDRIVKVWDAQTGQEFFTLPADTKGVTGIAFSSDGQRLSAFSRSDGIVRVWDAVTGRDVRTIRNNQMFATQVWSPNRQKLATIDLDLGSFEMRRIKVWDLAFGQLQSANVLQAHSSAVWSVAFSPDNKLFASAGADRTIKIWTVAHSREPLTVWGHADAVNDVAFGPDGSNLASAGADGIVKVWNLSNGLEVLKLRAFSSDNVLSTLELGSTKQNGPAPSVIDNSPTGSIGEVDSLHQPTQAKSEPVTANDGSQPQRIGAISVAFSHDGKLLATLGLQGVRVCNAVTGEVIYDMPVSARQYNNVVVTPDGSQMAVSRGSMGRTEFWKTRTGKVIDGLNRYVSELGLLLGSTHIALSPTGQRFAEGNADGRLRIVAMPEFFQRLAVPRLRSAPKIQRWIQSDYIEFSGHIGAVTCLVFSPDGERLVTSGEDGTVKVWNANTGQEILILRGHAGAVNSVAFSPDGNRIISGGEDGTVRIWDGTPIGIASDDKGDGGM